MASLTGLDSPLEVVSQEDQEHLATVTLLCERTEFVLQASPANLEFPEPQTYAEHLHAIAVHQSSAGGQEALRQAVLAPFLNSFQPLIAHFQPNKPITVHDLAVCKRFHLRIDSGDQIVIDDQNPGLTRDIAVQPLPDLPRTIPRFTATDVTLEAYGPCSTSLPHKVIAGGKTRFFKAATRRQSPEFRHELSTLIDLHNSYNRVPHTPILEGVVTLAGDPASIVGFLTTWIDGINLADAPLQIRPSCMPDWRTTILSTVRSLHSHDIVWGDVSARSAMVDRAMRAWVVNLSSRGTADADETIPPTGQRSRFRLNVETDEAREERLHVARNRKRKLMERGQGKLQELQAVDAMCDALLLPGPTKPEGLGARPA